MLTLRINLLKPLPRFCARAIMCVVRLLAELTRMMQQRLPSGLASDAFWWDDEVISEVVADWSAPEVNYPLTAETLNARGWLTGSAVPRNGPYCPRGHGNRSPSAPTGACVMDGISGTTAKNQFKRLHPCPSTGSSKGRCPGSRLLCAATRVHSLVHIFICGQFSGEAHEPESQKSRLTDF
jgi:hypothetical protein